MSGKQRVFVGRSEGLCEELLGGGGGKGQGVWREKSGGRKQEEGEEAVASSPSHKYGAGVTALAITPALF